MSRNTDTNFPIEMIGKYLYSGDLSRQETIKMAGKQLEDINIPRQKTLDEQQRQKESEKWISFVISIIFLVFCIIRLLLGEFCFPVILFIVAFVFAEFSFSITTKPKIKIQEPSEEEIYKNLCAENDARDRELNELFERQLHVDKTTSKSNHSN